MTYQNINLKTLNCSFTIGKKVIPPSWNLIKSNKFIGIDITLDLKDAIPAHHMFQYFQLVLEHLKT